MSHRRTARSATTLTARLACVGVFVGASVGAAVPSQAQEGGWRARVELRREHSSRGRPEESTKSLLRFDAFVGRAVESLRLELAMPDERQEFTGSIQRPRVGDVAALVRFRSFRAARLLVEPSLEATFPTAQPEELGGGKYRLGAALRFAAPLALPWVDSSYHTSQLELEALAVNSFAGDSDRRRFSFTRFDLSTHSVWRRRYTTVLRVRPTIDWVADGRSGAVAEIEGGRIFSREWRAWLMTGRQVWGTAEIASTYDTRIGLGVVRTF